MRIIFLLLCCATTAGAQLNLDNPAFLGSSCARRSTTPTTPPFVRFLTNLSSTFDGPYEATPVFTPSSNAFLFAHIEIDLFGSFGDLVVTNTGTTNLTWWPVTGTNINSVLYHWIYASQMPAGTAPFAMTLGVRAVNSRLGAEIHVFEAVGANTAQLWGSNAVVQSKSTGQQTGNPSSLTFAASSSGNALFAGVAVNSTGAFGPLQSPWTASNTNSHASPGHELASYYYTNAPAGIASVFLTNSSSLTLYMSMMEIRP